MSLQDANPETKYWKSPAWRAGLREAPAPPGVSRRSFLEAAGFATSLAALGGCQRAPTTYIPSLSKENDEVRPGRSRSFATTCGGCPAACGMLVTVRDGRPLKMEGMPEHPLSRGGLCAVGQALPMGLYDRERLTGPLAEGKPITWEEVDSRVAAALENGQLKGAVRVVTSSLIGPTSRRVIQRFLEPFDDAQHVIVDPISVSAILDAHERTHGVRVLPHYQLEKARVIVGIDADFLGTWISPVEFAAAWKMGRQLPRRPRSARERQRGPETTTDSTASESTESAKVVMYPSPDEAPAEMSRHVQFESRLTLTGSNADERFRVHPSEYGSLLSHLLDRVARLAGRAGSEAPLPAISLSAETLDGIAALLWNSRAGAIVLCGSQDVEDQVLANHLNELLESYGNTMDARRPSRQWASDDRGLLAFVEELQEGKLAALFVAGVDLVHDLPDGSALAEAISRVPLAVSLSERMDDSAAAARLVCPDQHPLESWGDAEPVAGLFTMRQPTMRPPANTRSALESFAAWSGMSATGLSLMRSSWREHVFPLQSQETDFTRFWDRAVQMGFVQIEIAAETVTYRGFAPRYKESLDRPAGLTLVLHPQLAIPDGRHAHNPWLQELPDPITKVTWDNCVTLSPRRALELGVVDHDIVALSIEGGPPLELPAFVQPGQHDDVLAVALGYGVRGTERFAHVGPQWLEARLTVGADGLVGVNAAPYLRYDGESLSYVRSGVRIAKTGRRHLLATTQTHDSLEVPADVAPPGSSPRDAVQETTLAEFRADPAAGAPHGHHVRNEGLWPNDHPGEGPRWGMAIDLNACTGCSACLIACQSENNVPVVGRDEVARHREMHWIRIDRYYAGAEDAPMVAHQPMMCQHCANAPCETVCPVLATVHSSDGLNQQVYNRCVGTRYCANNCPYKVRRFNWFNYAHDDQLANLALNPDVTVRMRGIMEKCSMCVQRIQEGKIESRRLGIPLADGMVRTACQQSCPTNAIVFGDLNDPRSQIAQAMADARRYTVLEELNVRPAVGYLRKVRNVTRENGHV